MDHDVGTRQLCVDRVGMPRRVPGAHVPQVVRPAVIPVDARDGRAEGLGECAEPFSLRGVIHERGLAHAGATGDRHLHPLSSCPPD